MLVRRSAATLILALCVALPASAGPRRQLPGHAEGILVMPGDYPWGTHFEPGFSWEWARTQQTSQYRFLTEGDGHFVPYFRSQPTGQPFNLYVEIPGENRTRVAADRDSIPAARKMGFTGNAHIVDVEVNDGKGGRGTHFIITSLRVIDGSDEVKWTLEDQLLRLRKRFDDARHTHRASLNKQLAAARRTREANPGGTILRELRPDELLGGESLIYHPVWHPDTRQLEVYFAYKKMGGFWIRSNAKPKPYTKQAPPPRERGVSYAAGMGAHYVVSAKGKILEERIYPPETMGQTRQYLPWKSAHPEPTPTPAALLNSKLHYYRTCGDPVCSDDGYRGPYPGVKPCTRQRQGDPCLHEGEKCDLQNNCNMFLLCSETDPSTRCAR